MLDSLTLTTIILGELVFLLSLGCALLGVLLVRERRHQKKIMAAYQRLRNTVRTERAQNRAPPEESSAGDAVADYLLRVKSEARDRYRNITQTNLPRLTPEHPFNAKIAALRFLFTEAEERAYRKEKASGDAWVLLEKQLYDIARWVVDRQDSKPGRQRNNQVKLLQQRVEKLKGFEKQARDLQRKLELNRLKREELEQLQDENRLTIEKLQKINDALSLSGDADAEGLRRQLRDIMDSDARPLVAPPERRLTNIEHFSADNQRLNSELARELRAYNAEFPDNQSEHLEQSIKRLEAELFRSEQHIRELKQQRSSAEAESQTSANEADPHQDSPREQTQQRAESMEQIEETLRVIHTNMADSSQALNVASGSGGQSPYSLAEIQQLRHNNTRQRNLIVDLEGEMRRLRDTIPHTEDDNERAQQTEKLFKLERLVKECEHCILALESEVDLLYTQLKEREQRQAQSSGPTDEEVSLEQLQSELSAMANRLEDVLLNSERDSILSQFAQASVRVQSIEELARCVISALKRGQLIAGFYLQSKLGHAEFFPAKQFSERERAMIRRTTISQNVAYLNEGIMFASDHMHLLLKDPHADELELQKTEQLLQALMDITGARVDSLEIEHTGQHQRRYLQDWSDGAHNTLVNMEIRYAYQVEETLRLVDSLVEQMQKACSVLEASEATRAVIDNALSECQHRIRNLMTQDDSIDEGCTWLLSHLDELPKIAK
ncbi:hypothetical protein [Marinimicrobium sp. LS-A18]|uniref:hypothetical protein n=1 Tax=Marinimicrobium sp. LS-A18 TaxID=1381596 RepID=UPI000466B5B4|nr:hypothetical protein [Marinimicrobium sp. LS-A18]